MKRIVLFFLFLSVHAHAQKRSIQLMHENIPSNLRSMSVVNDNVIWITGSKGYVARSTDGGKNFISLPVPGQDSADFRTLYAFSEKRAVLANTGSPARIFYMSDGITWTEVYQDTRKEAFLDGVDFWNESEGLLFGDPVDHHMVILRTSDGGETWEELPEEIRPILAEGEAAFAASGTTIRCFGTADAIIATGGKVARLFITDDKGDTWWSETTPMLQGTPEQGIFSVDVGDAENWVIVGGDYKNDSLATDHIFFTTDAGKSWQVPINPTRGYRECVSYIDKNTLIAVGPTGAEISTSSCRNWEPLSDIKGLHLVEKARSGNKVYVAGKGIFGVVK